jgi:hypothetical protein
VIVDPSHAAGNREWVPALARAALAAGADGLLVEAHPAPSLAWSDAAQAITVDALTDLVNDARLQRRGTLGPAGTTDAAEAQRLLGLVDAELERLLNARRQLSTLVSKIPSPLRGG